MMMMKVTLLYSNAFFSFHYQKQKDVFESVCRIPMITSAKEEQRMIATCRKVSPAKSAQENIQFIYLGGAFARLYRTC